MISFQFQYTQHDLGKQFVSICYTRLPLVICVYYDLSEENNAPLSINIVFCVVVAVALILDLLHSRLKSFQDVFMNALLLPLLQQTRRSSLFHKYTTLY